MAGCRLDGRPLAAGLARLGGTRRLIARLKPDVLITYNWGAIEWAMANRFAPIARHIHIEDGFGPEEREHQIARRVWFRPLALSGRHTTIVLPSHNLVRIASEQWRLGGRVRTFVQRSPRYPGGVALRFARVLRYRADKTAAEADTISAVTALAPPTD